MLKKILAILLICLLLCGCGADDILDAIDDKLPEKTYTEGDVSITLPNSFKNFSSRDMAEGKDFLFANDEMGITGTREDKETLYDLFGEMDAEGYANLIAELYELDTTAEKKKGYWYFTYEQEIDGEDYTYLAVIHETTGDYWNIQVYCKSADFEENEDTMWDYATDIEITDRGSDKADDDEPAKEEDPTEVVTPAETEPVETEPAETEPEEEAGVEGGLYTIDLPDDFLDYSNTTLGSSYGFMYMNDEIGVIGIQENKEELFLYFDEMDIQGYADLIAELYELENPAQQKDGFWTVSYTDDSTGVGYTYVGVFYETETDFWHVQAYCLTEQYEQLGDDIWSYITSVEFAEN